MHSYVSRSTGERLLNFHLPAFFQDKVRGDWGKKNIEPAEAEEGEKAIVYALPIDLILALPPERL